MNSPAQPLTLISRRNHKMCNVFISSSHNPNLNNFAICLSKWKGRNCSFMIILLFLIFQLHPRLASQFLPRVSWLHCHHHHFSIYKIWIFYIFNFSLKPHHPVRFCFWFIISSCIKTLLSHWFLFSFDLQIEIDFWFVDTTRWSRCPWKGRKSLHAIQRIPFQAWMDFNSLPSPGQSHKINPQKVMRLPKVFLGEKVRAFKAKVLRRLIPPT